MKRSFISLGAALVLFTAAFVGIASAQTTPPATATSTTTTTSTNTTTTDATRPYLAQSQAAPKPKPKTPFLVIHVGGMSTWNIGSSDLAQPSVYCATTQDCGATGQYQFADPVVHFDYGVQINLAKHFWLSYSHNYIDQNIGRVAIPSKVCSSLPCTAAKEFTIPYTYQKLNDDRVDDASLNYLLGAVTVSGGWHQRTRMCCGNPTPSDAANQVYWHDVYFQLAARAGPNSKYFGRLAGLTIQEEYIAHNTNAVFSATSNTGAKTAFTSFGSLYHTTFTPNLTYPIGDPRSSTFAVFAQYLNNFDYFMNAPIPYLYNEVDFGIIKKWPPMFTLVVTESNLYQHHSQYPYTGQDTINRNKLIMVLDMALPIQ
ncbi:MAG: hypothetical protein WBG27_13455 [Candidatus Aquilonibacter sp.]